MPHRLWEKPNAVKKSFTRIVNPKRLCHTLCVSEVGQISYLLRMALSFGNTEYIVSDAKDLEE